MNRPLLFAALVSFILFIPIALYLRYFPQIGNVSFSDMIFIALLAALFFSLVIGALYAERPRQLLLFTPQVLIMAVLVRAVPNMRLSYPAFHDPYYYMIVANNIVDVGSLDPVMTYWYSGVDHQIPWPDMQILTTALHELGGIELMDLYMYQEPFLGVAFFLGVFLLGRYVLGEAKWAFIVAMIATFGDSVLFYQSEYHPQGFGLIAFVFLLFLLVKKCDQYRKEHYLVLGVVAAGFVFSHHFSTLLFVVLGIWTVAVFLISWKVKWLHNVHTALKVNIVPWVIISMLILAYHLFVYPDQIVAFYNLFLKASSGGGTFSGIFSSGANLVISLAKVGGGIALLIILIYSIRRRSHLEIRLAIPLLCMLIMVLAGFVIFLPTDRIIAFAYPIAAIVVILALRELSGRFGSKKQLRALIPAMMAFVIAATMVATSINSQIPAYFLHDTQPNEADFYKNTIIPMDKYVVAGEWFGDHTTNKTRYTADFDAIMVPFYYAERSDALKYYPLQMAKKAFSNSFIFINPNYTYGSADGVRVSLDLTYQSMYDNGGIKIYRNTL